MDYAASLIISVYKDTEALQLIIGSLPHSTEVPLQVIVSEDGSDPDMAACVQALRRRRMDILHLTQDDHGFRKNRALNRAVAAASSGYLIFIDGDCLPHRRFVQRHVACAEPGCVCAGRRVELGPRFSRRLIEHPEFLRRLESPWWYLLLAPAIHVDGVKNYEVGLTSRWLHRGSKPTRIVGCNFSCTKADMLAINGFNEDYRSPGIGEDSDIEWRLRANGNGLYNVKFLATVYHLDHPRRWQPSDVNEAIFATTRNTNRIFCEHGISAHASGH